MLLQIKSHTDPHTVVVCDSNASQIDKSSGKSETETPELNDATNQMDLTDIYRTFHSNTKEYTFFSAPHRASSKIDHILGHKTSLNRYKKVEMTL